MYFKINFFLAAVSAAIFLSGCGKHESAAPYVEQNRLFLRLFEALKNKQPEAAEKYASTIAVLDRKSEFLPRLIEQQQVNASIQAAEKELNLGKYPAAMAILEAAALKYPFNRNLAAAVSKVSELAKLEKLVHDYSAAADSATRAKLLGEMQTVAGKLPANPQLAANIAAAVKANAALMQKEKTAAEPGK